MISEQTKKRLRSDREFIIPIMKVLQDCGGEVSDRNELTRYLPSYTDFTDEELSYSEVTEKGNNYQPYLFGRNIALINLKLSGFLNCDRRGSVILTKKGLNCDLVNFDLDTEIYQNEDYLQHKQDLKDRNKSNVSSFDQNESDELLDDAGPDLEENNKLQILEKLKKMDPYKFEKFVNGLLSQMGFEIDPYKGQSKSNDHGIDGFAYSFDKQTLTNSVVAVQCKRFQDGTVGAPEIDKFRGAVVGNQADYGIFFTTSSFSKEAKLSARKCNPRITLIDGLQLVELMIEHEYKLHQVTIWEVDNEFFDA